MNSGEFWVYATARTAMALYIAALIFGHLARDGEQRKRWTRSLWTVGCLVYLLHVAAAFQFVHHWSHTAAAESTSRRTAELLGRSTGGEIYFNYLFTLVWAADVLWRWLNPISYAARPRVVTWLVHGFLLFIVFNAVVVFGHGATRWCGIAACAALAVAVVRRRLVDAERHRP